MKILVVEDELIIAKTIARKIRNFGHTVPKIVTSGQLAIDYIQQDCPDLILMDIAIKGGMDGIKTAAKIKEIADIPYIFLTAYASNEIIERASKVGGYGYLIKPVRYKELQATINMAFSKHQEQATIRHSLQSTLKEYSSQYDNVYRNHLTDLPNKLFLRDIYEYFCSLLEPNIAGNNNNSELVGIFNIHLSRLEKISKFLTKEERDNLIQQVAECLNRCTREFNHNSTVVYLEADNYLVLSSINTKQKACNYGQEILTALSQPFQIKEREIFLLPNIGIAFNPTDGLEIEELLEKSTKAREYAKQQGGNRCQLFSFAFNVRNYRASETLTMESYLHHALDKQELELYYQPQIDIKNNSIVGVEALIRWNNPILGRLEANKFVPLAEETGLIKPITQWIFHSACKQLQTWHDMGFSSLRLGVNISGFQFRQSDLFHQMTQTLFDTSLDPQYLVLELTEKILVENIKTNIQRLHLLKKIGIKIALDDFGTGYSSLSYLQRFPFDILKIDPCFIRSIDNNQVNQVITQNIIELAHQLNLTVIAEGVETDAELQYLKECHCDLIQGFLYSHPLPASEFQKLFTRQLIKR